MADGQTTDQEGRYPTREREYEKILGIIAADVKSDRQVFSVIRDHLPEISRRAAEARAADRRRSRD